MATPNCPINAAANVFANSANNLGGMGIGKLGAAETLLKRKFRFVFGIDYCIKNGSPQKRVSAYYVKMASRPDITIEDTELNFLNGKTWIPGKASWETITVTYYDAADADGVGLLSWLATIYDFTSDCRYMASRPQDYAGVGTLVMLDGCGNPIEQWQLYNLWPTSIKFGELDYSQSDVAEVELTLRYSDVIYTSYCGGTIDPCVCTPCNV